MHIYGVLGHMTSIVLLTYKTAYRPIKTPCDGTSSGNQLFCVNHYSVFVGMG